MKFLPRVPGRLSKCGSLSGEDGAADREGVWGEGVHDDADEIARTRKREGEIRVRRVRAAA